MTSRKAKCIVIGVSMSWEYKTLTQCYFSLFLLITDINPCSRIHHLDLDGVLNRLALLLLTGNGLGTHDTTTPLTTLLLVLVAVTLLDGRHELGELGLVLIADLGNGQHGGSLDSS